MKLTEREIALNQALVALLFEAKRLGADPVELVERAKAGLLGNSIYRFVEHPHVSNAIAELDEALTQHQSMDA